MDNVNDIIRQKTDQTLLKIVYEFDARSLSMLLEVEEDFICGYK